MLPAHEIAGHLWAVVLIVLATCVPGYPLSRLLPRSLHARDGFATWPLLGGAYWAAMLYLLPFRGGLLLAAGLALAMLSVSLVLRRRSFRKRCPPSRPGARARRLSGAILFLGCAAYLTPVLTKHVPDGMDASRYVMNARLLARHTGLPRTLAPFAPEIPFGAANHGLPAVAAVAVLCGASPAAATLACLPLAYGSLILGSYVLSRVAAGRVAAALIAVAVCWLVKQPQRDILWGGYTGVFTLAVGILAARLLLDILRGKSRAAAIPGGLCVGTLPILHGCIAAGWLYVVAPVAAIAGLIVSRRRGPGLLGLLTVGAVAGGVVLAFIVVGWTPLDDAARQWITTNELHGKLPDTAWQLVSAVPRYLMKATGTTLALLLLVSLGVLVWRRRWWAVAGLAALLLLNMLTIANAQYGLLPASLLLYPSRLREFPIVAAGLSIALAWRALPLRPALRRRSAVPAAVILLCFALANHCRYYQRDACRPVIAEEAWHALTWSAEHLNPCEDFVATLYGTAGAYLPGVAGIAADNWHAHIIGQTSAGERMRQSRPPTHVLYIERSAIRSPLGRRHYDQSAEGLRRLLRSRSAILVFNDGPVTLYRLAD
ncbi:MAG: hypothetical protein KKI02_03805 [Planctomycetes bacterium]|nr:hypothetical protein [Planctomycetota bacterium]